MLIYAESDEITPRKWIVSVDGKKQEFDKKSGEQLDVPIQAGSHTIDFQIDSPNLYKGYVDISGKILSFVTNQSNGFQTKVKLVQPSLAAQISNITVTSPKIHKSLQGGTTVPQTYTIYSDTVINIGIFGQQANSTTKSVNLSYPTSKWEITSATLTIQVWQNYAALAAGVEPTLATFLNGAQVMKETWGILDTSLKNDSIDVTSSLINGINNIYCSYHIGFSTLVGQYATITSLILTVNWNYIGSGTPGTPPGSTLPLSLNTIILIIVVAVILATLGIGVPLMIRKRRSKK